MGGHGNGGAVNVLVKLLTASSSSLSSSLQIQSDYDKAQRQEFVLAFIIVPFEYSILTVWFFF